MNATAIAMNASASVNAIPRNMRPVRRPCSSGWRATDSTVLPTTMPTPMAGPIVATPKAIGAMWPVSSATVVMGSTCVSFQLVTRAVARFIELFRGLVFVGQGELDVYGCEECEDVCLQRRDEEFEEREDKAEGEGANAEGAEPATCGE